MAQLELSLGTTISTKWWTVSQGLRRMTPKSTGHPMVLEPGLHSQGMERASLSWKALEHLALELPS